MILVVGLGPIGANTGARLVDEGFPVQGLDLDAARAAGWSAETNAPSVASFDDVEWSEVDTVLVAVRTADQVESAFGAISSRTDAPLAMLVLTTLAPSDARRVLVGVPENWRTFEAPLSGGPQGARAGSMSIFLAGPELTDADRELLAAISGRVFETDDYGQPAELKLLNNTLGAYNALATATMIGIAMDRGISAARFLEVVAASSGQSWMSDNFDNFGYDLLFKDVRLLLGEVGELPTISHSTGEEPLRLIEATRARIAAEG